MPQLSVREDGRPLEIVDNFKLLGVHIRSDLKWIDNTENITKTAYERLWMVRRLKQLGASTNDLLDVYFKQIRRVLETAVPAWHSLLTKNERYLIERVQKTALHIILGERYNSYSDALTLFELKTLDERRKEMCVKFARKSAESDKFQNWFAESTQKKDRPKTRHHTKLKFKPIPTRTVRFEKSPIPYLASLLNDL